PIPTDILLPAPGQGALGLQCRESDAATIAVLTALGHAPTSAAVRAERQALRDLEGGCRLPVAALATPRAGGALHLTAAVAAPDGSTILRDDATGPASGAEALGAAVAARLLAAGAADLLRTPVGALP
ncbi:MAG TPA: hydroxymethylbilane synthase, partial [Chloroflexota bacterium]|nr:hydroxymethylbilane synthase [Chloroflexota bacterium]